MYIPDVIKSIGVKLFNLMSRTNETRHIKWNETCRCKCGLNASFCNNKQHWNNEKCVCECKELIYKGICDKSCDIGEYLDYENCKWRKKISENIDEREMSYNVTLNDYKNVCESCTRYTALFVISF